MKIRILATLLLIGSIAFGQKYPNKSYLGTNATEVRGRAVIAADSGFVNAIFADTSEANLYKVKNYSGAQIVTIDDGMWTRSYDLTRWIRSFTSQNLVFRNGILQTNTDVRLGGRLNENIYIDAANKMFLIQDTVYYSVIDNTGVGGPIQTGKSHNRFYKYIDTLRMVKVDTLENVWPSNPEMNSTFTYMTGYGLEGTTHKMYNVAGGSGEDFGLLGVTIDGSVKNFGKDVFIRNNTSGFPQYAQIDVNGEIKTASNLFALRGRFGSGTAISTPADTYAAIFSTPTGNALANFNTDGMGNGNASGFRFSINNSTRFQFFQFNEQTSSWPSFSTLLQNNIASINTHVSGTTNNAYIGWGTRGNQNAHLKMKLYNLGNLRLSNGAGTEADDGAKFQVLAAAANGNRAANFNGSIYARDTIFLGSTGQVLQGTHTPTASGLVNISAAIPAQNYWSRVGNKVDVFMEVLFVASATNTESEIRLTLPVATTFAATSTAGGQLSDGDAIHGKVVPVNGTSTVLLKFKTGSVTSGTMTVNYSYIVL